MADSEGAAAGTAARSEPKRWQALVVLSFVQLVLVLDDSVVNIAIPSVQSDLGFSVPGLAWVNTSYVLVFGGLLLLGGRLGDLLGRRRVFVAGVAMFGLASLACGLAQAPWHLLTARAVQGVGAALASPAALAIITVSFAEREERNKAFAMWGISAGVGGLLGMILGGLVTDLASWRWVFLINVPIAVAAAVILPRMVGESRDPRAGRADVPGGIAITAGVAVLIYGLLEFGRTGGTGRLWPSLAASAVLVGLFLARQSRAATPLIPRGFFRVRTRTTGSLVMLLMAGATMAQFFALSLYLQEVLDYSALRTGLALVPQAVISFMFFPLSAVVINRLGLRIALPAGLLIMAVGFALLGRLSADGSYLVDVLPTLVVNAVGGPLAFTAVTTAAVGDSGDEAGLASGVVDAAQQVGTAIGLALFVTVSTRFAANAGQETVQADGLATAFLAAAVALVVIAVIGYAAMGQTSLKASMGPMEPSPVASPAAGTTPGDSPGVTTSGVAGNGRADGKPAGDQPADADAAGGVVVD